MGDTFRRVQALLRCAGCGFLYLFERAASSGISPHQLSYVTHSNPGEGLLFFGNVTIPFVDRFPKNTKLYSIMTTRPEEKEAQNE